MSVDESGALVPKRVIGWHESPVGARRRFRLTYRSCKNAGAGRVGIEATGDHRVLTERGYVPIEELRPDDRIATGQGLSDTAFDVVCGSVLGDATLSGASAAVTFSHSRRQLSYARFKADLLEELSPREQLLEVAAGGSTYPAVHMRTLAHRAIGVLRRDFYVDRVKCVPEWLGERLNARMLAIWFMDDGYMRIRGGGRQPLAEIATVSFDDRDIQTLLRGLARLGLPATSARGRIYFNVPASRGLSDLIAPYVPEAMRYKLHPESASTIPFDPKNWERGSIQVLYDEIDVEDVTERETADKTFFCLDVEDTHNFVTAGGVVHNCRPPQNRDPLPQEIENCQGWLFSQLELIQPKVVCTLGNFATKLLRGDQTGITRLHGREEVRQIGPRAVRLYPIYHPAAALYTPSMV
jgi:hypothetical protein